MIEPKVSVGILFEPRIDFVFLTPYIIDGKEVSGEQTVSYSGGYILWQGRLYEELLFEPIQTETGKFEILDVTIGINFHWERKEDQRFQGAFRIIVEDKKLTGINVISVEDYLTSVISSEMSANASLELLKAHAVISRSWLLAASHTNQVPPPTPSKGGDDAAWKLGSGTLPPPLEGVGGGSETTSEFIRWYERTDHTHFDVCADDHCQRYQGITRASTEIVKQAIEATRGQVLFYDNKICDARFSKCCGGAFEEFQNCWDDIKYPYLTKQRDSKSTTELPDLTIESEVEKWIRTSPEAFCNTTDKVILSQVLNNYDQETVNFYRWKIEYSQKEISELIRQRSGIDFGDILDLIPVERGTSGRLVKLKIVGSKRTLTIGKELEIRRTLSTSHLYSSAFVVDKVSSAGEPGSPASGFILTGAGWGHGVGLCQIGAAVMGEKGYPYNEILLHYYIGANLEKLYE